MDANAHVTMLASSIRHPVPLIWNVLQFPPVRSPDVNTKVQSLVQYFDSTWIAGDFPPTLGLTSTTVDLVLPTWLRVSNFPQRPQLQVRDAASFDENFSGLVAEMPV